MTNPYREANCSFCLMLLFFHQRYYVLYMAPNLKFLDSTPVTSVERKEAKRIGAFTKVVSADFEDEVSKNCVFILIESPGCVNETLSQKMVRKFFLYRAAMRKVNAKYVRSIHSTHRPP